VALGARAANSPSEVAAASETVFTCLPSVKAITEVVSGTNGLVHGFRAGGTWVDMRTNDLHELKRLAALLAEKGVTTLEAPVTGGAHNAESATIAILVGGDEANYRKHTEAFAAMGGRVFYIGTNRSTCRATESKCTRRIWRFGRFADGRQVVGKCMCYGFASTGFSCRSHRVLAIDASCRTAGKSNFVIAH
jgi:6-phosphogluconate dehydrogenase (decarboxylating)